MMCRRLLLLITVSLAFYGLLAPRRAASQNDVVPARSYTFVATERYWDETGKLRTSSITYEVAADGSWVATREVGDGKKVRITQGADYQAVGDENEGRTRYFSAAGASELRLKFRSPSFLREHQQFAGTENVCGLVGYVLKSRMPTSGDHETVLAPETGFLALRVHHKFFDGAEYRVDPVSITFH